MAPTETSPARLFVERNPVPGLVLGIVGDRDFVNMDKMMDVVYDLSTIDILDFSTIVSGGARGADCLGEIVAGRLGYSMTVHPADWENLDVPNVIIRTRRDGSQYNARAGHDRNQHIVDDADEVIAFLADGSKGTQSTIDICRRNGVVVHIIPVVAADQDRNKSFRLRRETALPSQ